MSNFLKERSGGGLFENGATIIKAKFTVRQLPWHSEEEPAIQNALTVTYLNDEGREWTENEITTGRLRPTNDGEGLTEPNGDPPQKINKNSKFAKFVDYLEEGGFNVDNLFVSGELKISRLEGATFANLVAVDKVDKDGNPKVNDKGFAYQNMYPGKFTGYAEGYGEVEDSADGSAIAQKAIAAVETILEANGDQIVRTDLIKALNKDLEGDPEKQKVISLVVKGVPGATWQVDGSTFSTIPF